MFSPSQAKVMILFIFQVLLSGCAITTISHSNGDVETGYTLFSPVNQISTSDAGAFVEVKGVGFAAAGGQTALGAFKVSVLNIPPDCRLVLLPGSHEQVDALNRLVTPGPLCGPEAQKLGEKR